jgi:hypothetical protein
MAAASSFPPVAPPLGVLEAHAVVGDAVADGCAKGLEDALGIGAAGQGGQSAPRRDRYGITLGCDRAMEGRSCPTGSARTT